MDLIAAMQTEHSRGKRLLYAWAAPLNVAMFLAALVACCSLPDVVYKTLALCAAIGRIVVFVLRQIAWGHQSRGEEIRRMAMLQDGLNITPSATRLARLQEVIGGLSHHEPVFLQPYYDSPEAHGPNRLLDITMECAFFTSGNARRMWKVTGAIAATGFLVTILVFVFVVSLEQQPGVSQTAAKIVLASMAFWSAGDFSAMAFSFKSLQESTDDVLNGCEQALSGNAGADALQQPALILFSEYNCAVAKAPPIPAWIYERYRNHMNNSWRQRHELFAIRARSELAQARTK